MLSFELADYCQLNARQKETYNYQIASAILARYGFHTHRISDDWLGADFIARHMMTGTQLLVQLKGRLLFAKRYKEKDLWICFRHQNAIYLYPHDLMLEAFLATNTMEGNEAWNGTLGEVHWRAIPKHMIELLSPYRLEGFPISKEGTNLK